MESKKLTFFYCLVIYLGTSLGEYTNAPLLHTDTERVE